MLAMSGAAVASAQVQHQNHPPRDAGEYARVLEDPSRDEWQKPHEVVMALGLKSTEAVADMWTPNCWNWRAGTRRQI
jgi:predicted methyltransferase